ncbi:hypothetical protein TBLA_0D00330 [Henningerozyma blattae CBS 6284]|uniref:Splicing factor subunit n=1 Tax=Henningerozyma blattae (strain ATCC 34711 / CBS 6284 / DSM 70876 / NBRC 10599 / NRRL Y-10934 / UCD 77-7) TaxID=1071380 RepID=I2H2E1_HENB6|nr:hypothetical protein TBLA_0D00330 [Tetrapisispora blattae CBS 6284]CCH60543.1 hypothetical protein TBLA_0D00330 [Tetrapisispora blattae CBS 6284]
MQSEAQRQKQQYQILKLKYLGLGDESTTKEEWLENIQKDTYYSLQAHSALLEYISLGQHDSSKTETRIKLLKKMCENKVKRTIGNDDISTKK